MIPLAFSRHSAVVMDEAHRLRNAYEPSNIIANTLKLALANIGDRLAAHSLGKPDAVDYISPESFDRFDDSIFNDQNSNETYG